MVKVFSITGAIFIIIATLGFLLIQHFFENNALKNRREENINLVSSQKETVGWMEKANSYRELAQLAKDNIDILKSLNVSEEVILKKERDLLLYYRASTVYTINAAVASKIYSASEGEEMITGLEGLTRKKLHDKYLNYLKQAADGTFKLGDAISHNKKAILNLEKIKDTLWYLCFVCQSIGLLCGLAALFYRG